MFIKHRNKGDLTIHQTYHILENKQKRHLIVAACLLGLAFITVALDFLFSQFHNTSFYISEALLFSTFWLLFFPLLAVQTKLTKRTKKLSVSIFIAALMAIIHLFAYPAMIWFLSKAFYNHTFSYWQTFNFGITEYFIKSVIIYSLTMAIIVYYKNKFLKQPVSIDKEYLSNQDFITSIIISDINNKKTVIATNDVLFFSANTPYIDIHHKTKKYLHKETLKSLETQLDSGQFLRIHKSCIVNICKVVSYKSRLNGDYDLTLSDDTRLRVSRNYVPLFKSGLEESRRLTIK